MKEGQPCYLITDQEDNCRSEGSINHHQQLSTQKRGIYLGRQVRSNRAVNSSMARHCCATHDELLPKAGSSFRLMLS